MLLFDMNQTFSRYFMIYELYLIFKDLINYQSYVVGGLHSTHRTASSSLQ